MSIFKGSGVALITPFNSDKKVDYDSLSKLIDFHLNNETDAIIVCGTTGEASTLEDYEHLNVIDFCVSNIKGNIPVIAGTGSNNTNHAIWMSKEAEKIGIDALLLVTPYYNKATQKGLEEHYKAISKNVDTPILLYNVPSRTGLNMNPRTIANIVRDNPNIVGIKEASGNIMQVKQLIKIAKEEGIDIDLYSGNDDDVISVLDEGGIGVISVCANIVPRKTHDMVYHYIDGDLKEAKIKQEELKELSEAIFSEVNPIPIKNACYKLGLIQTDELRLPLTKITKENEKKLVKIMKKQGIIR